MPVLTDDEVGLGVLTDADVGLGKAEPLGPPELIGPPEAPVLPPPRVEAPSPMGGMPLVFIPPVPMTPEQATARRMAAPSTLLPSFPEKYGAGVAQGFPFVGEFGPKVQETDPALLAAGKALVNVGLSLPEFATSPLGALTAAAGPIAPRVTSAAFSIDMLGGALKQFPEVYAKWGTLSPARKIETAINLGAAIIMGGFLGKKAVTGYGKQPMGRPSLTQQQAVRFTAELAEKDPETFGQLAKEQVQKAVDVEQRQPTVPVVPVVTTPAPPAEKALTAPAAGETVKGVKPEITDADIADVAKRSADEVRAINRMTPEEAKAAGVSDEDYFRTKEYFQRIGELGARQLLERYSADLEAIKQQLKVRKGVSAGTRDVRVQERIRLEGIIRQLRGAIDRKEDLSIYAQDFIPEQAAQQPAAPAAQPEGVAEHAISQREATEVPVEVPPGDRGAVGAQVREQAAAKPEEAQGPRPPEAPVLLTPPAAEAAKPAAVPERLLIRPRTDGMVSLEDSRGARLGTFKTVDDAAKAARDLGYSISSGSPLKPTAPSTKAAKPDYVVAATEAAQAAFERLGSAERGASDLSKRKGMTKAQLARLAEYDKAVEAERQAKARARQEQQPTPGTAAGGPESITHAGQPRILSPEQRSRQAVVREALGQSKSAHEALTRLVEGGQLKGLKGELAKRLVQLGDMGAKLDVGGRYYSRSWGTEAAGKYDHRTDTVHVYDTAFENNKSAYTLLHEYIHALTRKAIDEGRFRTELDQLFSHAYIKAQRTGQRFHGVSETALQYGREYNAHLHEFVAEAMSNAKFQEFLKGQRSPIRGKVSTLWDQFVDWVSGVFGIKPSSSLHDALKIGLDLAESRKADTGKPAEQSERGTLDFLAEAEEKEPSLPSVGAASAAPGGIPPRAAIEQLADAFAGKAPTAERLAAFVRNAFNFGVRGAKAKDALSAAVQGMKTSGTALWDALTKFQTPDDLLKAKGDLSAELETRGWRVREFVRNVQASIPDKARRAAIAKWIDAGGDDAVLAAGEAATKPEYKQAYRDARNLTADEKIQAQNIQNYFDTRLQEAIDAGVLEHGLDDYIHRIYEKDPSLIKRALAYVQSGILSRNPALAKKRLFEFDWQAEQQGFRPVQDFLPRIAAYEASLSRAIAARKFVQRMSELTAPDGRPIVGIKGVGVPIEDPVTGAREGTVIKPLGDFRKNRDESDALNYRGDYEDREFPALSKWKWVSTDAGGKPIFVQGDVAIHPDYVKRFDALLKPSSVRKYAPLRTAQAISATVKQTMLDMSFFHQVQIAVHGLEHRVNPFRLVQEIDFENPNVQGLLKGGVTLGGEYYPSNLGEGLVGRSLTQHIPGLGQLLETYHGWLFQSFIPRMKLTMGLHALERNRKRYAADLASGRMSEDALYLLTAKQANAAFGELNYTMLERNKTVQDMARLILLAPDFLEARGRFAAQALTKYGTEQRVALLLGAITMWTAARVMNKIADDQWHLEPENLFNLVWKNNAYGLRTVQGDVLHMLTKPIQFWTNRLNPVYGRTMMELLTQRDQFGRKRDMWEQLKDAISTVQPIATRSSRERHLWESVLNSFGVTARRWNDVKNAHELASKWKKENNIREQPGEFIYDSDKDPLRPLKLALSEQDDAGAVKELKRVLDSKAMTPEQVDKYFNRYAAAPFTGSRVNDVRFMASLSADDKKTVQAAQQHRRAMLELYRKSRRQLQAATQPRPAMPAGVPLPAPVLLPPMFQP